MWQLGNIRKNLLGLSFLPVVVWSSCRHGKGRFLSELLVFVGILSCAHNPEVVGSSPSSATNKNDVILLDDVYFFASKRKSNLDAESLQVRMFCDDCLQAEQYIKLQQPYCASEIDATAESPDATRHPGFLYSFFTVQFW